MRISFDHPLLLGSGSPRRREMIALLGIPMAVRAAEVDESQRAAETPDAYLERIIRAKLEAIRAQGFEDVAGVLVADTIVVAPDGRILGKPADEADARGMLDRLTDATHDVRTRFLLADPAGPRVRAETVITKVTFRALGSAEASAYVATAEGNDKAGAYAVQGKAAAFVQRIDGSYTNVVGLPLSEVVVAMRAMGWL